jgi:hypothetical protein
MKRMEIVKILSILMAIATVIYVGTEVYAYNHNPLNGGIAYSATLYEGEIPPPHWYTPEQLGAVFVADYGDENATVVWLVVPPGNEPFPLREVKPIFKYKERFYQVSELCIGYPVPSNLPQQPVGAVSCGIGWLATGILWLKWRKEDETTKIS